ncbi:MAG: hypothetical protein IPH62_00495 [Ignavibacteriae bacterium]|nr:hypothetical protein [Ignavibacteriota bacterium]
MVLQQEFDTPIWGWAKPNSKILISKSWDNSIYSAETNENGEWFVKIKTQITGGPYTITIYDSALKNIMIV